MSEGEPNGSSGSSEEEEEEESSDIAEIEMGSGAKKKQKRRQETRNREPRPTKKAKISNTTRAPRRVQDPPVPVPGLQVEDVWSKTLVDILAREAHKRVEEGNAKLPPLLSSSIAQLLRRQTNACGGDIGPDAVKEKATILHAYPRTGEEVPIPAYGPNVVVLVVQLNGSATLEASGIKTEAGEEFMKVILKTGNAVLVPAWKEATVYSLSEASRPITLAVSWILQKEGATAAEILAAWTWPNPAAEITPDSTAPPQHLFARRSEEEACDWTWSPRTSFGQTAIPRERMSRKRMEDWVDKRGGGVTWLVRIRPFTPLQEVPAVWDALPAPLSERTCLIVVANPSQSRVFTQSNPYVREKRLRYFMKAAAVHSNVMSNLTPDGLTATLFIAIAYQSGLDPGVDFQHAEKEELEIAHADQGIFLATIAEQASRRSSDSPTAGPLISRNGMMAWTDNASPLYATTENDYSTTALYAIVVDILAPRNTNIIAMTRGEGTDNTASHSACLQAVAFASGRDIRIKVGEETDLATETQAKERREKWLLLLSQGNFGACARITDLATFIAQTIDDDDGGERMKSMKDVCKQWKNVYADPDLSDELNAWEDSVQLTDNDATAAAAFDAGEIIGHGRVSLSLCPYVGGDQRQEVKFPGFSPFVQFNLQCTSKDDGLGGWLTRSQDRARAELENNVRATQGDYANVAFETRKMVAFMDESASQRSVQGVVLKALGRIQKGDVLILAMCQGCTYANCQCGVADSWKQIKTAELVNDRESALRLIGSHINAFTPGPETHRRVLLRNLREVGDLARRGLAILNVIKMKGGFTTIHSSLFPATAVWDYGMHSLFDARIDMDTKWKEMLTQENYARFIREYGKVDGNDKATAEQIVLNATLPQVATFFDEVLEVVATNFFRLPEGSGAGAKLREHALMDAAFVVAAPGSLGQHEHLDHKEFLDNDRIGTLVVAVALTAGPSTVFIKPPQKLRLNSDSKTPLADNKVHWKKWEHYDFPCVPGDMYAFPGGKAVHNGPKNESREQRAVMILVFGDEQSDGTPIMEDVDHWPGEPENALPPVVSARRAHN